MIGDIQSLVTQARANAEAEAAKGTPAARSQRDQLAHIAQEFESMLLGQVLREMRKSGSWEGDEDKGEFAGFGNESFMESLDSQLATHLASVKGLGLSAQLLESFDRLAGSPTSTHGPTMPTGPMMPTGATPPMSGLRTVGAGETATGVSGTAPVSGGAADPLPPVQALDDERRVQPVSTTVTSGFGWRSDPFTGQAKFHRGMDLQAAYGQDVQAAASGTVVFSGEQKGYGTTVVLEHADGSRSRYAHLSGATVAAGTAVEAGQVVGRAGRSGRATGTHLHFEVTGADGRPMAPDAWLRGLDV